MVVILPLPKGATPPQQAVDALCAERLPGMDDRCQRESRVWLKNHMDVVGHDAPRVESVPHAIKMAKSTGHNFRRPRVYQATCSASPVQVVLNTLGKQSSKALLLLGRDHRRPVPYLFECGTSFCFDPKEYFGRQRIGLTKGHEINGVRRLPVREAFSLADDRAGFGHAGVPSAERPVGPEASGLPYFNKGPKGRLEAGA